MMRWIVSVVTMIAAASLALAGDEASTAKGKELFTGSMLGTNGKSCSSCHQDGKRLARAAKYDGEDLGMIINQCITGPLRGEALDPSSAGMKSLILYIKSLAPAGRN